MAEQKDTVNKGVPMSNGIGGTVESGSSTGSGGGSTSGNSNTGSGSVGGSNSAPSSAPSSNSAPTLNDNVEYVKNAVDNYLGASALAYSFQGIVELYVNKKLGFETIEKEYLEKHKDLTKEEIQKVKDSIKQEKENAIKLFKEGAGKDELKKKFDEFKSSVFELQKNVKAVPKEFTKAISEAVMPNVIGPVGPNPLSIALKTYNSIARIKKVIDTVFISLQVFIGVAESLGVDKEPAFNTFMGTIAGPLRTLEAVMENLKKKEEEQADDLELQAKIEEAKKSWSYPHDSGRVMNAEEVEELARGDRFKMFQFPLTGGNRKDLDKAIKKIDSNNSEKRHKAEDAKIIKKYDDWTRWFLKQLNAKNDSGARATTSSGTGQSDGTFSGDTRL